MLIGLSGFFLALTMAGLIQGTGWLYGTTVYVILPELHIYWVWRLGFGILIVSGAIVGLYNIARSLYGSGTTEDEP